MNDNPSNITKYAIVIYIIAILLLYIVRPNIIYNKETNQFREFGFTGDKSILCLPVLAIILAILIYILCSILSNKETPIPLEIKSGGGRHKYPVEYLQKAKNKLKFMAQLPMLVDYSDIFNNLEIENQ